MGRGTGVENRYSLLGRQHNPGREYTRRTSYGSLYKGYQETVTGQGTFGDNLVNSSSNKRETRRVATSSRRGKKRAEGRGLSTLRVSQLYGSANGGSP